MQQHSQNEKAFVLLTFFGVWGKEHLPLTNGQHAYAKIWDPFQLWTKYAFASFCPFCTVGTISLPPFMKNRVEKGQADVGHHSKYRMGTECQHAT